MTRRLRVLCAAQEMSFYRSSCNSLFPVARFHTIQPWSSHRCRDFPPPLAATGHSNTPPDIDGIVRRIPLVAYAPDKSAVSAFALETLRILQPTITAPIKVMDRFGRLLVNFNGPPRHVFTTISASDVLRGNFDAAKVAGKIVFVGSSAADLHDDRLVPTSLGSPMPGVEIHASLADTIRSERWLVPVPKWIEMLLLFAIGLFFGLVVTFYELETASRSRLFSG